MGDFKILIVASILLLLGEAYGVTVRLEGKEDMKSQGWQRISCRYIQDYEQYSTQKCSSSITLYPLGPSHFEGTTDGVWGICSKTVCEFEYFDMGFPERIENVTVRGIVGGNAEIKVEGKRTIVGSTVNLIGEVRALVPGRPDLEAWEEPAWFETADEETYVIIVTVTVPGATDFALIDWIELDYGEEVLPPPTTTTAGPTQATPAPPAKYEYEIDRLEDLALTPEFTASTCVYSEHVQELWVWGCPNNATQEANTFGFWGPCNTKTRTKSCHFIFNAGSERPFVTGIEVEGVFENGSSVRVFRTANREGAKPEEIGTQVMGDRATKLSFEFLRDCDNGVYNISLSGETGVAAVNKIKVTLLGEDKICPALIPIKGGDMALTISLWAFIMTLALSFTSAF